MFDFSFAELFIVIAVAIFLIGPKDIPGLLKSLGQGVRRLQYIRYSMTSQFDKFMDENNLNEIRHFSVDPMEATDEKAYDEAEEMLPLKLTQQKSLEEYVQKLIPLCSKKTAYRPGKWRKNNPLFDHCVPISLAIQDEFGGELKIVTAVNKNDPKDTVGHVYNVIDGKEFDGTVEQFQDNYTFEAKDIDLSEHKNERALLLDDPDMKEKYELFKAKIAEGL